MTTDIQKKKHDRFIFLKSVFEVSNGDAGIIIDGFKIGNELGFERNYSINIFNYLNEEGLVEPMGAGIHLVITHAGIKEIEQALSEPEKSTEHFLPFNQYNTINIHSMSGGAIQQASINSNINIVSNDTIIDIENYIERIKKFVVEDIEDEELKDELLAEIETVLQQSKSPKPKNTIIRATLNSIKDILVGSLSSVIGTLATPKAQEFIQYTEQILQQLPT